ncbi:MAG: aromatic amino acid lyase, partial [Deltaproteobacteria bacterium]|nr:aromatic amino acid lyase [Deltaproteobacteria bacterium]
MKINLQHDQDINLEQISAVGDRQAKIKLDPKTRKLLRERRNQLEQYISDQEYPAYGFNRGFGHNVDLAVGHDLLPDLQKNLIVSHAVGLGDAIPDVLVRYMMFFRAQSLCRGYSGVRPELVEQLIQMLN